FNSPEFIVFLILVIALYYLAIPERMPRARTALLTVSSYLFYMAWAPPFALLLLFSTILDFNVGRRMARTEAPAMRRLLLALSITGNLGVLGYFKYGRFFAENIYRALGQDTWMVPDTLATLVVPVGISFYTFQALSYTIDIYRRRQEPAANLLDFACFVAFFPQLVAGPIVRSRVFLPQLASRPKPNGPDVEYALMRIGTGFLKKIVFADVLAGYVDVIFDHPAGFSGFNVLLGFYAYAYQIYFDFSGYSDIAIGTARLFGFKIPENFNRPYLSANPREFWQRWHISLSTWLRDYLYISLGGNRRGPGRVYVNLALTMLLGGLWHGAAATFVFWGAFHGLWLALHRLWTTLVPADPERGPLLPKIVRQLVTFHMVCLGWVFFRAQSIGDAWVLLGRVVDPVFNMSIEGFQALVLVVLATVIHTATSVTGWRERFTAASPYLQGTAYALIATAVFLFAPPVTRFIYFQF
ncbi:MAG: MBOAT family protein, partial [Deltaproteobacteria bacterium]